MRKSPIRLLSLVLLSLLCLVGLPPPARAQCQPDGLDGGPCCLPTGVVLPAFPAFLQQSVRYVCFRSCQPTANASFCASIGVPTPVPYQGAFLCGVYDIPVRIRFCSAPVILWAGTLRAHYSRNWQASSLPGAVNLTVWRFLVNGDLRPTSSLPTSPDFRPACQPLFKSVYFSGYVDYALDCISNTWQISWNINHECDGVHHAAGSARPAPSTGLHPTRSYSFIGPGTSFQVSPTPLQVSNGPITQKAMRRNDWSSAPKICTFEEPASGIFLALNDVCVCSSTGAPQYNLAAVNANGACGSSVAPDPNGFLMQKRLGFWNNPNVYPGNQTLLFDFGYLDHFDGCIGVQSTQWFEGTETLGGYPAYDFNGLALDMQFEDLASANQAPTVPLPWIGAPHVVHYLLNFNIP